MATKRTNPRDLNLINLRAAKKREAALKLKLKQQSVNKAETMKWIKSVEARLLRLESLFFVVAMPTKQKGRKS